MIRSIRTTQASSSLSSYLKTQPKGKGKDRFVPFCLFCSKSKSTNYSSSRSNQNSSPNLCINKSNLPVSYRTNSNINNSNTRFTSRSQFFRFYSSSSNSSPPESIQLSPTREPTSDLKEDDPDLFTTLNRIDRKLNLTDRAIQKLISLCEKESNPNLALRLAVEPGGCHGYQYDMKVVDMSEEGDDGIQEDDYLFSTPSSYSTSSNQSSGNLLIDSASLPLLNLCTLDYATELIGSQFVIKENPNAKGGGCGCGVSWEPKDDLFGGDVDNTTNIQPEKSGPVGIEIGEKGKSNRINSTTSSSLGPI